MFAFSKTLILLSMVSVMVLTVQASFGFGDPPVCASPNGKAFPKHCDAALDRYNKKGSYLVSPARENQKSCYDCQIKLTASYEKASSLQVLPDAAHDAIKQIQKACKGGYGAVLIARGPHDFQDPTILSIEVGSGRC